MGALHSLQGKEGRPMAVRQDLWRGKRVWTVDFRYLGKRYRRRSPVNSKRGARAFELEWKRKLEAEAVAAQAPAPVPCPTFGEFAEEFMRSEAPTTSGMRELESKRSILDAHLLPRFKDKPLDTIKVRGINEMVGELRGMPRSPKTINNILTLLKTILRYACTVEVLVKVPPIKLLPVPPQEFDFLDFDEYAVVRDAIRSDPSLYLAVLLGAEAGLRAGEIAGLQWQDINFQLNRLRVSRQLQAGHELPPKWNSVRSIPLSARLARALKAYRHLQGEWVLVTGKTVRGRHSIGPWTKEVLRWRGERVYRLASLPQPRKPWHCLRHTFCSHLAMRGVPGKSIQELAGHKSLTTTMRYMHLSPAALQDAISKLDEPAPWGQAEDGAGGGT